MYIIIINKFAGSGRALKVFKQLSQTDLYQEQDCSPYFTKYPGHAEILTAELVRADRRNITAFVVIGGDGTVHEVLNGLKEYTEIPLSFIPAGSGNDFARGYGIKGKPLDIFKKIIINKQGNIFWPGIFSTSDSSTDKATKLFANSIGFGFDAEIAKVANQSRYKYLLNKWRIGSLSYVLALLQVLKSFKPKTVQLTLDGNKEVFENVWMVTIANHPYYGGGMKILPQANNTSSQLSVLVIRKIAKWKVLLLFITVFVGKHTQLKEVTVYQAKNITVTANESLNYQVDGQQGTCLVCNIHKQMNPRLVIGTVKKEIP